MRDDPAAIEQAQSPEWPPNKNRENLNAAGPGIGVMVMQAHTAQHTQLILQAKKMENRIMKQYETIRLQKERQDRGPLEGRNHRLHSRLYRKR